MERMNRTMRRGFHGLAACFGMALLGAILSAGCDSAVGDILQSLAAGEPIVMAYIGEERLENEGSISFGTTVIGDRSLLTVRLENIGAGTLSLIGVTIGGEDGASFPIVDERSSPLDIEPAASIDFSLGFQPTSAKACVATVTFSTNDPDSPTLSLALSGTGLAVPSGDLVTPTLGGFGNLTKTTGDGTFTIAPPTSDSIGAFSYASSDEAIATVASNLITIRGAGSCQLTATQAASGSYRSATISATLTVNKMSPGLANFGDMIKNYGDAAFVITSPPSSSSNGQITYSSGNTGVATISGTTVTIHAAGSSVITASQAETAIYAAGAITATLTVNPIAPSLGAFGAMSKNYGDAAFAPTAPTSNSSGAFSYSSGNTAVATSNGSTLTVVGVGTSTITAIQAAAGNYTSASTTATLTVSAVLPTVTTTSISGIRAASATGGGNVTSGGGSTVTARGVCWSTSTNPTTASSHTTDSSGTGSFASSLTGLAVGTTYYVRAYATNGVGTSYGGQVSFQAIWAVGDTNWGGTIVTISGTYGSQHGLVFCENNLGGAVWSNGLDGLNANSTTDGLANTSNIVATQGTGTYAAKICADLSFNGYDDWYLPAKDQLTTLYNVRGYLTNYPDGNYWSSTQWVSTDYLYANEFNYPGFSGRHWSGTNRVRAVRNF